MFFERYPTLARSLPHVALGSFPTPLERLDALLAAIDPCSSLAELHVKDDGRSSATYGGNKVRKLELVLGEALRRGAREVLTFGFAGSNHAAATAVHASALGLRSISMLLPQADAPYVRANLLVSDGVGAELHGYDSVPELSAGVVAQMARHRVRAGRWPFVIAPGGSSPLGTVGFVAAAFELAAQLEKSGISAPDWLYVALGSGGTAAGLALGLAAAGLPTRVVAVRVTELKHSSPRKIASLWNDTASLLRALDPAFPASRFDDRRIVVRDEFFGGGYAVPTPATEEAIRLAHAHAGLHLDPAYTGKALACLIADARRGDLAEKRVVFWNTYSAVDLGALKARGMVSRIPERLRRYVEEKRAAQKT